MPGVHETDQRRRCLDLGERHGLDIHSVTKLVVESFANTGSAAAEASWTSQADLIDDDDTQLNAATTNVSVPYACAVTVNLPAITKTLTVPKVQP